jgi:hypothetical protein
MRASADFGRPRRRLVSLLSAPALLSIPLIWGLCIPSSAAARAPETARPRGVPAVPASPPALQRPATALPPVPFPTSRGAFPVRGVAASGLAMMDSYPRDGDEHILPNAELFFVFNQRTHKTGTFTVADIDSNTTGGVILNLDPPRWSALGDTVYLKPSAPMTLGHLHGMRVNGIIGYPSFPGDVDSTAGDQGIIYYRVISASRLVSVAGPVSPTLVPDQPTPIVTAVREMNGNAVTLTQVRTRIWSDPTAAGPPDIDITMPVLLRIERSGAARLSTPVTVPLSFARADADGRIGIQISYTGADETALPVSIEAFGGPATVASLVPVVAGNAIVRSAVLEWPLPGAVFSAGDTLRPRAVVIGDGTGPFRAAFYMDGEVVALEEGFLESGRPDTLETRRSIPTRRFGEHRLQFVVESPQNVASQPVTFLSAPPARGLTPRETVSQEPPDTARAVVDVTWLADARSSFREEESSAVGWAALKTRYNVSATGTIDARITSRLRFDDPQNGSASPEQLQLRYHDLKNSIEWGDGAPAIAVGSPLLASTAPRRAAQAAFQRRWGVLEGYAALESKPTSSAGPLREIRSDLYAGRLTRTWVGADTDSGFRFRTAFYGGYTHEDPTPGGVETAVRARAIYGGTATLLSGSWTLLGDIASVRHRTIENVETGRTRTGARAELTGTAAQVAIKAEAFRYQPSLATALNPYALSDRRGFAVDVGRNVLRWRPFAGYRRERPEDESSGAPSVTTERIMGGMTFLLNQDSWVTPAVIHIRQKGPQTDFTQNRLATEITVAEVLNGRTTARFDAGKWEDAMGVNTKRRVYSGSIISTRRHKGNVTSTISAGIERDENQDLHLRDKTIQGALEVRFEAILERLLVTPYVTYLLRDYELAGTNEDRLGGRLQISLLKLPGLGDAAFSVQGRVDRIRHREPIEDSDTETAVEVFLGKRSPILP